jgi:prevent-host-death family protein
MAITKIKSAEARIKWRDIIDRVYAGETDIIIERSGKEVAVLISVEDYEAVRDSLVDLRADRMAAGAYLEWQQDSSVARPWEDVEAEAIHKGLLDA